jgi:hypothetical protein
MSEDQVQRAAIAWLDNHDTFAIARKLGLPEHEVAQQPNMFRICARARFLRTEMSLARLARR